jgi:hypothetical protein
MERLVVVPVFVATIISLATGSTNYTGYSGAPGSRGTCSSSCHGGSGGTITVSGFPTGYVPGQSYLVSVGHSSGSSIRNFNCSVRVGSGSEIAGTIVAGLNTSTYTHAQELVGVHLTSGSKDSCNFTWTAPSPGVGDVKLYLAGLQGSSMGGPNTVIVLTATQSTGIAEGEPRQLGHVGLLFAPSVVTRQLVVWAWTPDQDARLTLLDAAGRVVGRKTVGRTAAVPRRVTWLAKGGGRVMTAGAYLAVLETRSERVCRRFVVK